MATKTRLILSILFEFIITLGMLYYKNYWAASGWGLFMLSNISLLLDQILKEKKEEINKLKKTQDKNDTNE